MPNPEPRKTLFIAEEAEPLPDYYEELEAYADKHALRIGGPWPCKNFFKQDRKGNEDGKENSQVYQGKVVKIQATDCPKSEGITNSESKGKTYGQHGEGGRDCK